MLQSNLEHLTASNVSVLKVFLENYDISDSGVLMHVLQHIKEAEVTKSQEQSTFRIASSRTMSRVRQAGSALHGDWHSAAPAQTPTTLIVQTDESQEPDHSPHCRVGV